MHNSSFQPPKLEKNCELFLKNVSTKLKHPLYELSPIEAREFLINLQKETHKLIEAEVKDTKIENKTIGDINIRIVKPIETSKNSPAILYLHGGGWILGGKQTHDMLIRRLAIGTNSVLIFVNYTHSPEAKYPLAINQAYAALEYIYKNPEEFSIDAQKISVAGDSAGANMATVLVLKNLKDKKAKINAQLLFYPVTDLTMSSQSYHNIENPPWLSPKAMKWFIQAYLPQNKNKEIAYVSPLFASIEDLRYSPKTLILTAENDILRDEGELYAQKLLTAGVEVTSVRINHTIHDFLMLNALQNSNATKAAFELIFAFQNNLY